MQTPLGGEVDKDVLDSFRREHDELEKAGNFAKLADVKVNLATALMTNAANFGVLVYESQIKHFDECEELFRSALQLQPNLENAEKNLAATRKNRNIIFGPNDDLLHFRQHDPESGPGSHDFSQYAQIDIAIKSAIPPCSISNDLEKEPSLNFPRFDSNASDRFELIRYVMACSSEIRREALRAEKVGSLGSLLRIQAILRTAVLHQRIASDFPALHELYEESGRRLLTALSRAPIDWTARSGAASEVSAPSRDASTAGEIAGGEGPAVDDRVRRGIVAKALGDEAPAADAAELARLYSRSEALLLSAMRQQPDHISARDALLAVRRRWSARLRQLAKGAPPLWAVVQYDSRPPDRIRRRFLEVNRRYCAAHGYAHLVLLEGYEHLPPYWAKVSRT
jgi:hypothetical protein